MSYLEKPEWALFITCKVILSCFLHYSGIVLVSPGMNFLSAYYKALQSHVRPNYGLMQCIRVENFKKQISELVKRRSTDGKSPIKAIGLNKNTSKALGALPSFLPLLKALALEGININHRTVEKMSKLPKLSLLILLMENCYVSGKLETLTTLEELHLKSFNFDLASSRHVGKTILFPQTLKKLDIEGNTFPLGNSDNDFYHTIASAKLCTQLDSIKLSNRGDHIIPLLIVFPKVACLKKVSIGCPVTIIKSRNATPFANVIDVEIDWSAIKYLSQNMYKRDITTFLKKQTCIVFSLFLEFIHFENICITNYECKPCLFVKFPAGTQKTLVTLISKAIKNTDLAKRIQLTNPSSTTTQSISKTTTITKVVHEIELDDKPITRLLRMFENQTKITNLVGFHECC